MATKKATAVDDKPIPLGQITELRFVDGEGYVYRLARGRMAGAFEL